MRISSLSLRLANISNEPLSATLPDEGDTQLLSLINLAIAYNRQMQERALVISVAIVDCIM